LGGIKGPIVVDALISALKDEDLLVRRDAAEALGRIKDPRSIQPLIAALNFPTSEFWRLGPTVVEALASFGESAVQPLINTLKDPDWQIRRNAATALGEIRITAASHGISDSASPANDPRAVASLLAGLKEPDSAVIVGACKFFLRRGEPGSESALIQALNARGDSDMAVLFLNSGNPTIRRCTPSFLATPAIVPMPNSYSRRIRSNSSTLLLQSNESPPSGLRPNQSTRSPLGGPKQTAEVGQIRIPKSRVLFCDNGSEFTSQAMDLWAYQNGVQIDFSRPGKPTDNAFIESFNGTLRDECLNAHWFANLAAARQLIRKRLVTAVGVCPGGRDELGLGSNRCPLTE
jgi:hypothetical protein